MIQLLSVILFVVNLGYAIEFDGGGCPNLSLYVRRFQKGAVTSVSSFQNSDIETRVQILEKTGWEDIVKFVDENGTPIKLRRGLHQMIPTKKLEGGNLNLGVYSFTTPEGENRVVKILMTAPKYMTSSLNKDHMKQAIYSHYLGELGGGPQVKQIGVASLYRDGKWQKYYYVEMEQLFPGEKTWTLKGISHSKEKLRELLKLEKNGRSVAESMADQLMNLLKKGIVPHDPDFMISASGGVRFIDAGLWRKAKGQELYSGTSRSLIELIRLISADSPKARTLLSRFVKNIQTESGFSEEVKLKILQSVFGEDLKSTVVPSSALDQLLFGPSTYGKIISF